MLWPRRGTSFVVIAIISALIVFATSPASGSTSRVRAHASADAAGWTSTADQFAAQTGQQFTYDCQPPADLNVFVEGTDTYEVSSVVCAAAVHHGDIAPGVGGVVTIQIGADAGTYTGSVANGVTSQNGSAGNGSFTIVSAVQNQPPVAPGGSGSQATLKSYLDTIGLTPAEAVGAEFVFTCPPNGTAGVIIGTHFYSGDSSVCYAGVHSGAITLKRGGKVTIQVVPELASYDGGKGENNTFSTSSTGTNKQGLGAFAVIGGEAGPDTPQGVATGNVLVNGKPFDSGPVPYGSTVDVTGGTLTVAAGGVGSVLTFGDGTDVAQYKLNKVVTKVKKGKKKVKETTAELALQGGSFASCGGFRAFGSAAPPAGKNVRSLWASGKGHFRTKGKYSSATIRGTKWQTSDRCDGTLTSVSEGSVTVFDFKLKKNVVVKAGSSYLAKA